MRISAAKNNTAARQTAPLGPLVGGAATWRTQGLPERLPSRPAPERLPAAETLEERKAQIHRALAATGHPPISITRADGKTDVVFGRVRTPLGDDVMLTEEFIQHVAERDKRERFANFVLPALRDPAEIWLSSGEVAGRVVYRRRFIAAFDGEPAMLLLAEEDPFGWLAWTAIPWRRGINRRRAGSLLYRRQEGPAGN